jgi:hypothetical protein
MGLLSALAGARIERADGGQAKADAKAAREFLAAQKAAAKAAARAARGE